jgi:hypothetical protein
MVDRADRHSGTKRRWRIVVLWLPLLVTGAAWVVSYLHSGILQWSPAPETCYFLSSHRGHLEFARQSVSPAVPEGEYRSSVSQLGRMSIASEGSGSVMVTFSPHHYQKRFYGIGKSSASAQFGLDRITPSQYRATATLYAIPYWMPAAVAAVPAIVWLARRLRARRRTETGRCLRCGYDLRATPGRCPECGTEPTEVATVATAAPE